MIKTPEEVLPKSILNTMRDKEEEFENFKFPDGSIREGFLGSVAIITYPDYEYGYSYLINKRGAKIILDFGDFTYTFNNKIHFKEGKTIDPQKDCFNGPYYKRLYFNNQPTDKILYYGFWADCHCNLIDEKLVNDFNPFDRLYVGGIIENGICHFLGTAEYEGFTNILLNSNLILTKLVNIEGEYRYSLYPDYYDEVENYYFLDNEDEWDLRERYGVFDIKAKRQIISNNLYRIEVKNDSILLYATKNAEVQLYYPRHPRKTIKCVQLRIDQFPYCFEPWRPALIESPSYFDEEHGIINVGLYAGLDIFDLIGDNRQLLLALVRKNYFHLDTVVIKQWEDEYQDLIPKSFFNKLYVANDAHHLYKDINEVTDSLEILGSSVYTYSRIHHCNVPLHTCRKHGQYVKFAEVFLSDFDYIFSLIKLKRVFVSSNVLKSFEDKIDGKHSADYCNLLDFVTLWEKEREEAEVEIERIKRNEYNRYLEDDTDYDRDTYYALGGDDYDAFRERGGSIDDMMVGMGY